MAFVTILTAAGEEALATANATNTPLRINRMQVGDGGGTAYEPTTASTELKRVVWTGNLNVAEVDAEQANRMLFEAIVPASSGGYTVREAALLDANDRVIAIANVPEAEKPQAGSAAATELTIRMFLEFSGDANVTMTVDPGTAIATRSYVDGKFTAFRTESDGKYLLASTGENQTFTAGVTITGDTTLQAGLTVTGATTLAGGLGGDLNGGGYRFFNLNGKYHDFGTTNGAVRFDCAAYNYAHLKLSGAATLTFANLPGADKIGLYQLAIDAGSHALTVTDAVWEGGQAPTLPDNGIALLSFFKSPASTGVWGGYALGPFAPASE